MQYLLTEEEMSKYVKKSDLEYSEKIRELLFNECQPKGCIHLDNTFYRCDGCPLSRSVSNKELCQLEQSYSKQDNTVAKLNSDIKKCSCGRYYSAEQQKRFRGPRYEFFEEIKDPSYRPHDDSVSGYLKITQLCIDCGLLCNDREKSGTLIPVNVRKSQ